MYTLQLVDMHPFIAVGKLRSCIYRAEYEQPTHGWPCFAATGQPGSIVATYHKCPHSTCTHAQMCQFNALFARSVKEYAPTPSLDLYTQGSTRLLTTRCNQSHGLKSRRHWFPLRTLCMHAEMKSMAVCIVMYACRRFLAIRSRPYHISPKSKATMVVL